MTTTSERQLVTLRGGFVVDWTVVQVILELEAQGARFEILDASNRFRVSPTSVLTPAIRAFLRAHLEEARAVVAYTHSVPM